jgi:hypothetical protein
MSMAVSKERLSSLRPLNGLRRDHLYSKLYLDQRSVLINNSEEELLERSVWINVLLSLDLE